MEYADQWLAATDAHGEQKVNFWQAPTDIPKWKEEQVLSVSKLSMYTICDRKLLTVSCISLLCCAFLCCMPNMCPSQIVLGVLSAWGVVIFTSLKVFGGKKEQSPAPAVAVGH